MSTAITWLKAKLFLLSITFWWVAFFILMSPIQLPVTIAATWVKSLRIYRYGLWIGQDQLINAIHGGNPDITVSSRLGFMAIKGSKTALVMEKVVNFLFYISVGQKDHCRASIEHDEQHYT